VIVVDTGIFVSAADRDEPRHKDCADVLRTTGALGIAASVIPEAAWMIERRLGPAAEVRFLSLVTSSRFDIVDLIRGDYQRIIELVDRYSDLGLGFVDASIVASPNGWGRRRSRLSITVTSPWCVRRTVTASPCFHDRHRPRLPIRWRLTIVLLRLLALVGGEGRSSPGAGAARRGAAGPRSGRIGGSMAPLSLAVVRAGH
jgi:uncharacterized protein